MSDQIYDEREKEKACEKAIALVEGMSNSNAANHWRAIEEEKLRKRISELEAVAEAAVIKVQSSPHGWLPDEPLPAALIAAGYLGGGG